MKQALVTIASPAGGVGKSTTCKELASIFGATVIDGTPIRTCLVDANIMFGCQKALLDVASAKYDITDWLRDHRKLAEDHGYPELEKIYDWDYIQKYLTYIKERNIYLLAAPEEAAENDLTTPEADILYRTLHKFFDVVIIDTQNDTSSATISAIELATHPYCIIIDDECSVSKMLSMRRVLNELDLTRKVTERGGIIFNRYHKRRRERYMDTAYAESRLSMPVVSVIPDYPDVWVYNNHKAAMSLSRTPVTDSFRRLAHLIVPEVPVKL